MAERKAISKKLRFEVFKRDAFKCQYCGRTAPDVVLEVDHIVPVAEGGKNTMLNLVTSCRDCNRGKGKRRLSDTKEADIQRAQLEELQAKSEQTKMMIEWRRELMEVEKEQIYTIQDMIWVLIDHDLTERDTAKVRELIHTFGFAEVCDALEIALDQYVDPWRPSTIATVMGKLGGICYNRRKRQEELRMR